MYYAWCWGFRAFGEPPIWNRVFTEPREIVDQAPSPPTKLWKLKKRNREPIAWFDAYERRSELAFTDAFYPVLATPLSPTSLPYDIMKTNMMQGRTCRAHQQTTTHYSFHTLLARTTERWWCWFRMGSEPVRLRLRHSIQIPHFASWIRGHYMSASTSVSGTTDYTSLSLQGDYTSTKIKAAYPTDQWQLLFSLDWQSRDKDPQPLISIIFILHQITSHVQGKYLQVLACGTLVPRASQNWSKNREKRTAGLISNVNGCLLSFVRYRNLEQHAHSQLPQWCFSYWEICDPSAMQRLFRMGTTVTSESSFFFM